MLGGNRHYAERYRKTGVASAVLEADPHRLVALLLAGACERVRLAEASLARADIARKAKAIGETCAIVSYLNGSLDHKAGGEIADGLATLYDYVLVRLTEANLRNDPDALREVLGLLGEIESAWKAIPEARRQGPAGAA